MFGAQCPVHAFFFSCAHSTANLFQRTGQIQLNSNLALVFHIFSGEFSPSLSAHSPASLYISLFLHLSLLLALFSVLNFFLQYPLSLIIHVFIAGIIFTVVIYCPLPVFFFFWYLHGSCVLYLSNKRACNGNEERKNDRGKSVEAIYSTSIMTQCRI